MSVIKYKQGVYLGKSRGKVYNKCLSLVLAGEQKTILQDFEKVHIGDLFDL